MTDTWRRLGTLAIGAAMQASLAGLAFAQGTPTTPAANPPPPTVGYEGENIGEPAATSPTETEPATELPVLYVTSVEIIRSQTPPQIDIVKVTGFTGSQGWSSPELVPTYVGKPLDGILDLQFVATMPLQTETAIGFVPISTVFPLEQEHAYRGVRVRASENAIEVDQIPGIQSVRVALNDCRDCVGKKFAERGKAAPGMPGVVRQEDLPKILRWIPPDRGIRGITHDPNRLNLLLSRDSTIIAAYWE